MLSIKMRTIDSDIRMKYTGPANTEARTESASN